MEGRKAVFAPGHAAFQGTVGVPGIVESAQGGHGTFLGRKGREQRNIHPPIESRPMGHGNQGLAHASQKTGVQAFGLHLPQQALAHLHQLAQRPAGGFGGLILPRPDQGVKDRVQGLKFPVQGRFGLGTSGRHFALFVPQLIPDRLHEPLPGQGPGVDRALNFSAEGVNGLILPGLVPGHAFVTDPWKLQQHENHHGQGHHNGGNLPDKHPDPFQGTTEYRPGRGQVIGGHFHDKGGGFLVLQHGEGQQFGDRQDQKQADGGDIKHGQPLVLGKINIDQQDVQGHLGQAIEHGNNQNGGQTGTLVGNPLAGHDPGHGTSPHVDSPQNHGQGGLAVQTVATEKPVHDKGHAGHVAAVLQKGDAAEENKKDGNVIEQGIHRIHQPEEKGPHQGNVDEICLGKKTGGHRPELGQPGPGVMGKIVALDNGKIIEQPEHAHHEKRADKFMADQRIYAVGEAGLRHLGTFHTGPAQALGSLVPALGQVKIRAAAGLVFKLTGQQGHLIQKQFMAFGQHLAHPVPDHQIPFQKLNGQPSQRIGVTKFGMLFHQGRHPLQIIFHAFVIHLEPGGTGIFCGQPGGHRRP